MSNSNSPIPTLIQTTQPVLPIKSMSKEIENAMIKLEVKKQSFSNGGK